LDSSKSGSILNNPRLFESCCTFQPVKIGEMITQDINSNLFSYPDYQSEPRYITYTDMSIDSGTGNKYEFEFDTALDKITKIHHLEWDVNSGKSLTDEFIS